MRNCSSRTTDLVREIEALKEDNRQLRAALTIYIEVVRRSDGARIHRAGFHPDAHGAQVAPREAYE